MLAEFRRLMPGASDEQIAATLAPWELHAYTDGGEITAVGMLKGTEFHLHTMHGFRLRRSDMREGLRSIFERHGFLTTRVAHDDEANKRFNKLFGFQPTWADDRFQYFMMTELPFGERTTCQQ